MKLSRGTWLKTEAKPRQRAAEAQLPRGKDYIIGYHQIILVLSWNMPIPSQPINKIAANDIHNPKPTNCILCQPYSSADNDYTANANDTILK